ncbi:MAG: polysaccharide deacetylase [Spiribacter salinus]|uniref:Polysaccharide deacetylase n=1 Tax=Spiribacter salinus TaxID=1335746 RepID=A0A540VTN1_9GAMM|nr:MAG: polysaccharide deacetylase [Spiribacter salinus]
MNAAPPCNVFYTVDVEMWPPSWDASAADMLDAFKRFILGVGTPRHYGLPYQLELLEAHGLRGVFFVEPLFASVLGLSALEEVVGLIREAGQDVQLHLHPEWLGRAGDPRLPGPHRLSMHELDVQRQTELLRLGAEWLESCGAESVTAFRAGSFGADRSTLLAVAKAGLKLDSSQSLASPRRAIDPDFPEDIGMTTEHVLELPLTTYRDVVGARRPLQLGSAGWTEMRQVLEGCAGESRRTAVILSHSAELLDGSRQRADRVVIRRLHRLCRFLERRREQFPTVDTEGALDLVPPHRRASGVARRPLSVGALASFQRYAAQGVRRWCV